MIRPVLLVIFGLAALPAQGRDLFVDNLAGYIIETPVLEAPNCAGAAFDDVTLTAFEQALCEFHRPARSAEATDRAISLMVEAQTRGLPPAHQQLAGLVSGLAHCSNADRHLAAYRASNQQSLLERTYFCRDRRQAIAELNAIRWDHAFFEYAEGLRPEHTLEARLTEMSACHAGVLAPAFGAECGLLNNLSETEINAFVDEAVADVIVSYFSGVESPITAMFSRKLARAEGLLETAGAAIERLGTEAAGVNAEYEALNDAYLAARDVKMAPIYADYRSSILRATAILDEFDRWKAGLFISADNVNLLPKIKERAVELAEELARIEELEFRSTAAALTVDLDRIVNSAEGNRQTIAALCRIYFCELTSRRALPQTIRACRRPALANNPLCLGQDGRIAGGVLSVEFGGRQSVGVVEFCRGAGVDQAFLVPDLAPATAAACLAELP